MVLNKKKILKNAQKYTKKGAWDAAIEEYKKLLTENPKDRNLHNTVGDLYAKKGANDEAIVEYIQAAKSFEEDGFIPQTIALYRKILRIDSGRVDIYVKLAQLYSDQGLTRDAIAQHKIVADHYTKKGLVKKALDTYKQIADLDPTNLKVRIKLGELYNKEGLQDQAVSEYLKIADILNKKGSIEESFHLLQKVIEIDPSNVDAHRGLARIYVSKGVFDKAVNALEVILEHDPDNLQNLFLIGKAYFKAANYEQAQTAFERILSIDPTQIGVRENLGRVYLQKGEFDSALVQFDQVIDNFISKKEYEMAKNLLNRLIQFKQDHVRIRERMIEISEKTGDEVRALEEFKSIAEIYVKTEDYQKAVNIYDNLSQKHPTDAEIRNRLETLRAMVKPDIHGTSAVDFGTHVDRELDEISVDDLMEGVEVDMEEDEGESSVVAAELTEEDENEMIMDVDFEHMDELQVPVVETDDRDAGVLNDAAADDYLNGIESEIDVDIEIADMDMPEEAVIERETLASVVEEEEEDISIVEIEEEEEEEEDSIEIDITSIKADVGGSEDAIDYASDDSGPQQIAQEPAEPPEELTEEKIIEDHFYHAEVYIKYGMTEKALDHLQSIIKIDTFNRKAYRKLFSLHVEKGNRDQAIAIALDAAAVFEKIDEPAESEHFYHQIQSLQPDHPAVLKKFAPARKTEPVEAEIEIEPIEVAELQDINEELDMSAEMALGAEEEIVTEADSASESREEYDGHLIDGPEEEQFDDMTAVPTLADDLPAEDEKRPYSEPAEAIPSSREKTTTGRLDSLRDFLRPPRTSDPVRDLTSKSKQNAAISAIDDLDKLSSKKEKKVQTASIDKLDSLTAALLSPSRKPKEVKPKVTLSDLESAVVDGKKKRSTGLTPASPLSLDDVRAAAGVKTPPRTVISSTKKSLDDLLADSQTRKPPKTKIAMPEIDIKLPAKKEKRPPVEVHVPLDIEEEVIPHEEKSIEPGAPVNDDYYDTGLEEAEFYTQQGLIDDARRVYQMLLRKYPDASEIRQKLEALELEPVEEDEEFTDVDQEPDVSMEEADDEDDETAEDEEEFEEMDLGAEPGSDGDSHGAAASSSLFDEEESDIAAESESANEHEDTSGMLDFGLGDEMAGIGSSAFDDESNGDFFNLDSDSSDESNALFAEEEATDEKSTEHSLQDLFDEFKRGVDEQVSSEDYETHYNLGIAYKEMGLVDEAIMEFEKAARSKSMALQCCSMIGLCHMENKNYQQAADEFKGGIDTPGYEPEEYLGLQYDLGLTYELLGDAQKAFEAFSYVYSTDTKFREVSQKVKELRKKLGGDDGSAPGGGNVTYV